MKGPTKKEIINEFMNIYASRWNDYLRLMDEGKYEEARDASNDCTDILVKVVEVRKMKASDIAKLIIDGSIGLGSLGVFTYLGVKSFKFEENGTFSSTGGKAISNEAFRRLTPPKV